MEHILLSLVQTRFYSLAMDRELLQGGKMLIVNLTIVDVAKELIYIYETSVVN